ncbi:unnamed protein product [Trichobilharzia regenti]|nr:unnamed protein product [Trichobilharzia regenti]
MGKGQSSYDFEVQRRRIMKIYERDVIELEKAAKTCGSNIDHLRRTIQEWLKQLYVCTPSILLRIRKLVKRHKIFIFLLSEILLFMITILLLF